MIKNVYWYSCKEHVILVQLWLNFNFLDRFSKYPQISNLTKIHAVGAELFHVDGRTDRGITKLTVAFRNFANTPKNWRKSK